MFQLQASEHTTGCSDGVEKTQGPFPSLSSAGIISVSLRRVTRFFLSISSSKISSSLSLSLILRFLACLSQLERRLASEESVSSKKKSRLTLSDANTGSSEGTIPTCSSESEARPQSMHVKKHEIIHECTRFKDDEVSVYSMHGPSQLNNAVEERSQSIHGKKHESSKCLKNDDVYYTDDPNQSNSVAEARPQSIHVKEHESHKVDDVNCMDDPFQHNDISCMQNFAEVKKLAKGSTEFEERYQNIHVEKCENCKCFKEEDVYFMEDRSPSNNVVYITKGLPEDEVMSQKLDVREHESCTHFKDGAVYSRSNSIACISEPKARSQCIPVKESENYTCGKDDDVYSMVDPSLTNDVKCIQKRVGEVNEFSKTQNAVTICQSIHVKEHECSTCIKDNDMCSRDNSSQVDCVMCVKNCGERKFHRSCCDQEVKTDLRDAEIHNKGHDMASTVPEYYEQMCQVPDGQARDGFTLPSDNVLGVNSVSSIISGVHRMHTLGPVMLSEGEEQIYDAIFSNDSGEDSSSFSQLVFPGQWDPWDIGGNTGGSESDPPLGFLPSPSINVFSDMVDETTHELLGKDTISDHPEFRMDASEDLHRLCELLGLEMDAFSYNDESRKHLYAKHDVLRHDGSESSFYSKIDRVDENDFSEYASCLDSWIQQLLKEQINPFCCAMLLVAKASLHKGTGGILKIPSMVCECLVNNHPNHTRGNDSSERKVSLH